MRTAEHLHNVTHEGWAKQILGLVVFLLICFLAAYLGQLATMPNIGTWYAELAKPAFNPPSWVFGPVWSVLYALMAISAWLVWRETHARGRNFALGVFFFQLAVNVTWSWAFFAAHSPFAGLIVILVLIFGIVWTISRFWRISRTAAGLLAPYLAWVLFATVLNASIYALN